MLAEIPSPAEVERLTTDQPSRFPISSSVLSGIAVAVDTAFILGSGVVSYLLMVNLNADTLSYSAAAVCSIWLTVLALFQFSYLYRFEAIVRPVANLDRILISFFTSVLFLVAAAFALKVSQSFSRAWIGTFALSAFSLTILGRVLFAVAVRQLAQKGVFRRNVIVAGIDANVTRVVERLLTMRSEFISITALCVDGPGKSALGQHHVLAGFGDIPAFVRNSRVDDIIIAMPWSAEERILSLIEQLRELPVNVYLGSDLVGLRLDIREPAEHFGGAPIFPVIGHPMSGWAPAVKAVEDFVLGLLFLAIAAIPMVLISVLIRLDSPGPALFKQKRLGFNNREFWIYKFRTMRNRDEPERRTVQAKVGDPRVTRVGRFLRRSSLDELPQLLNVLNGSMSLVGPRPHAVDHNEDYARKIRGYFGRHRVKPGLTGWAQVNGLRGETDTTEKMEARVRYDVYYTDHWSLMFDLSILVRTIFVLILGRNAY